MNWDYYVTLNPAQQAMARFWFYYGLVEGQVEALWWQMLLGGCGIVWDPQAGRFVARAA